MNIVAHMLVRNEADIIEETLTEISAWGVDTIVILDGASDDGTIEAIHHFALCNRNVMVELHSEADPNEEFHDHLRTVLLNYTRLHEPDWIISLDADEIYDTNPVEAIEAAEASGCNVLWNDIPQFWITHADIRNGLLMEDGLLKVPPSIQRRRLWYSWGHTGVFIWKDNPKHFYPENVPKRTPEHLDIPDYRQWQRPGPIRPICKHYCFRSLPQAIKRMGERLTRGGHGYFGKYELNWIIDEVEAGLHYRTGSLAPWVLDPDGHRRVHEYMGRIAT